MRRIGKLSVNVASQIAAGEVVERPASVVKELLENSIDAGSSHIKIEIHDGGLGKIKITDNGHGIHKDDLELALYAHATSKIKDVSDLNNVTSLGFRGEALASIGSIAKVLITSRRADDSQAHSISVHGGEYSSVEDAVCDIGTTIEVDDIFYTVPVRRKFF